MDSSTAVIFYLLIIVQAQQYVLGKVTEDPESGCWVWGGCGDGRYGHAYFMGQRFKAHRLAWLAFKGRIKRRYVLDHEVCDRPACCNPDHLRAVTQSSNIKRCFATGRGRSPFLNNGAGT